MPVSLAAAIEFCGPTLRYAAVGGSLVPRLVRLGEIAFEADAWALLDDPATASTVADAVRDALGDAGADRLTVVVHAPDAPTWTAAFPADADDDARDARLAREADVLLTDEDAFGVARAHLVTAPLGTDGARMWVQAVALTDTRAQGIATLAAALGLASADVRVGAHAATGAAPANTAPTLAVGLYGGSGGDGSDDGSGAARAGVTEFALAVGGGVRVVGHAPTAEPVDAAFAALRLVASVGGGAGVGALALYGPGASRGGVAEAFEAAFGVPATALDALARVGLAPGRARSAALDASAPMLAPVVGAALASLGV